MLFLALPMTLSHVSKKVSWSNSLNFKSIPVTSRIHRHMLSLLLFLDFASQTWRRKQVSTPSSFAVSSIYRAYWCLNQGTDDCWHQRTLACAHRGSTKELGRMCRALARVADPPYNLSWHLEEPFLIFSGFREKSVPWASRGSHTQGRDDGDFNHQWRPGRSGERHQTENIFLRQSREDLLMYWNWGERESQVWHEN